jgi:adenine-specific DNA-methyltransferase
MDDLTTLARLSREELIALIREKSEGGVKLEFSGKSNARRLARRVRPRVQRAIAKYSAGSLELQSKNLLIEGDNLQSMVTLHRERGQVDLILTDPPYNTGQDFRYNDRWDQDPNDPGIGELISDDDAAKHTKWMRFMLPRLIIMKSMLRPGGVLAICIDHRELFRLGQILDEIFGERNRLAIINWQKNTAPKSANTHVSSATEYVLIYANDADRVQTNRGERSESNNSRYGNVDDDPLGQWREGNLTAPEHRALTSYAIQSPFTGELFYPAGNGHWRRAKKDVKKWLEEWGSDYIEVELDDGEGKALLVQGASLGELPADVADRARMILETGPWPFVWFGRTGDGRPRVKTYLDQLKRGTVPVTYWADDDLLPLELGSTSWGYQESGRSSDGVAELTAIVGAGHGFETVKPLRLFQKIIQLWCPSDGTVLDPFAGSGTTAHAVIALNDLQEADRRFILIEQGRPENGDSYARTLTAERLQRVISGSWSNGKGQELTGGYRFVALEKKVDADALLAMEREEMVDTVIASHYDTSRQRGMSNLIAYGPEAHRYLVARNGEDEGFFLIWEGTDRNTDFNEDVYEACSEEARAAGLKPVFHVYARYNLFQTENVRFYQIPDRILIDFGLDVRNDAFADEEDA